MNPRIPTPQPKGFYGVLKYNFRKVEKGEGEVLYAQDMPSGSFEEAYFALKPYEEMRARTKNRVFSCSLNPAPGDEVSDELFVKMAQEFMEGMGYGKQPYIVIKHTDIKRPHIHIIAPRIDWHGKKIDSSFEQKRARKIANQLEVKYGLKISQHNNEQLKEEDLPPLAPLDITKGNVTRQMQGILLRLLPELKYQSIGELNCLLEPWGITAEKTQGEKHDGKQYDGIVYIPINKQGEKCGNPIDGRDLGRGCGLWAVQNACKKNKELIAPELPRLRKTIGEILKQKPTSIAELTKALQEKGLDVRLRMNEEGRIYGATYIDWKNRMAINGSRLGKEFTANQLNLLFNQEERMRHQQAELQKQGLWIEWMKGQEALYYSGMGSHGLIEDFMDALLNDYNPTMANDIQETAFANRLRREQRQREWQGRRKPSL